MKILICFVIYQGSTLFFLLESCDPVRLVKCFRFNNYWSKNYMSCENSVLFIILISFLIEIAIIDKAYVYVEKRKKRAELSCSVNIQVYVNLRIYLPDQNVTS